MRLFVSFLAVAYLCSSGVVRAGETPLSPGGSIYCQSTGSAQPKYFSGVFVMTGAMEGVDNAFTQELFSKYGFKGTSSCSVAYAQTPIAKVKEDLERQTAQLKASGTNVVQTNWVYVPETTNLPRFCFAYVSVAGVTTAHVTDVLEVPGSVSTQDLQKAWKSYASKQYANSSPQCMLLTGGEVTQKNYTSWLEQAKAKNFKIERVAWSYGNAAPGAAASAAGSPALNAAVASTAGNAERSYFCYGNSVDQKIHYITPLAPLPASASDPAQFVGNVLMPAWAAYFHGQLGQAKAAYSACGGGGPTARVQAEREQMLRTGTPTGAPFTQVDWRYAGGPASSTPVAAPAAGTAATPSPSAPSAPSGSGASSDGSGAVSAGASAAAAAAETAADSAKGLADEAKEKTEEARKKLRNVFGH